MQPQENDVWQDKYGNNYIAFILNGVISFVGKHGNFHEFNEEWIRVLPECCGGCE
jgi:hypothetical protein